MRENLQDAFVELHDRLHPGHQVLEIDARRTFRYTTMDFDTPRLRCLVDHLEDRLPRFKARSRFYKDTGAGMSCSSDG